MEIKIDRDNPLETNIKTADRPTLEKLYEMKSKMNNLNFTLQDLPGTWIILDGKTLITAKYGQEDTYHVEAATKNTKTLGSRYLGYGHYCIFGNIAGCILPSGEFVIRYVEEQDIESVEIKLKALNLKMKSNINLPQYMDKMFSIEGEESEWRETIRKNYPTSNPPQTT